MSGPKRRALKKTSPLAAFEERGTKHFSGELSIKNRQKTRPVHLPFLSEITRHLLEIILQENDFDITIILLDAKKMTRLNQSALRHEGSTDVITFDFSSAPPLPKLAGEINLCIEEALLQSARFASSWQSELVRYVTHGILHLRGHDDHEPAARRLMKREENRLLRKLSQEFDLSKLATKTKVRS